MSRIDTLERAHKKYITGSHGPATTLRTYIFRKRSLGDIYPQFYTGTHYKVIAVGFAQMYRPLEKLCHDYLQP